MGFDRFLQLQRQILKRYRHRPLPVDSFVALLDGLRPGDVPAFFDAWRRGDARIDAAVDRIESVGEGAGYRVVVRRTGNVPYPIDYEIETPAGELLRYVLAEGADAETVLTAKRPLAVELDPEGVIPMQGSSHPGIRRLWLSALYSQDMDQMFVPLARVHVDRFPGDHAIRYRLARRLHWLGRWEECAELWAPGEGCSNRDQCLSGIYPARSLGSLGRPAEASAVLNGLERGSREAGVGSFWETVNDEVSVKPQG